MKVLLDVSRSPDARLVGTAARLGHGQLPFSGTLELLARIEELLEKAGPGAPSAGEAFEPADHVLVVELDDGQWLDIVSHPAGTIDDPACLELLAGVLGHQDRMIVAVSRRAGRPDGPRWSSPSAGNHMFT